MALDLKTGFLNRGIKWAVAEENDNETYVQNSFRLAGHLLTMTYDLKMIFDSKP